MKQMRVVTDLGHVSRGHGVWGENRPTQAGGPQVIRTQRLLLGFTMRRESPRLFCNNNNNNNNNNNRPTESGLKHNNTQSDLH